MTKFKTEVVQSEGFTLSRLVWRFLGRHPRGYVEQTLALNPGLAALGGEIPVGTAVRLPLDIADAQSETDQAVRLWD